MRKLNNKGLTLVELLVAMTVLSIFMVTVTAFVTTLTKSTKKTRQQVAIERESQEVYDTVYDAVIQATCLIVRSNGVVADATTASAASTSEAATSEAATTEDTGGGTKLAYKTDGFEGALSGGSNAYLISKNAYMSILYARQGSEDSSSSMMSKDDFNTFSSGLNLNVSKPMRFKKGKLGRWEGMTKNFSLAQYTTAMGVLNGEMAQYGAFDSRTYEVTGLALGPVSVDTATKYQIKNGKLEAKPKTTGATPPTLFYNTLVYDKTEKKVYLNRSTTPRDFSTDDKNLIAENCTNFTVKVNGQQGSIVVNMTFENGGFGYTVGGTINLRNLKIVE